MGQNSSRLGFSVKDPNKEALRELIYEKSKDYVVKIVCVEESGKETGFFDSFPYCEEELLLTSGSICGWGGATKYYALLDEGTPRRQLLELRLLKTGRPLDDRTTADGIVCKAFEPDVALLSCKGLCPRGRRPLTTVAADGDTAYIVGYKTKADTQLTMHEGIVAYMGLSLHVVVQADVVCPGSPVLSADGFSLGMVQDVQDGEGSNIKKVKVVKSPTISMWLRAEDEGAPYPGFPG